MSTVFSKKSQKLRHESGGGQERTKGWIIETAHRLRCSLCRGELYPGDPYFDLDGRTVCEDCLGRYARDYFAPRLRRAGGGKGDAAGAP